MNDSKVTVKAFWNPKYPVMQNVTKVLCDFSYVLLNDLHSELEAHSCLRFMQHVDNESGIVPVMYLECLVKKDIRKRVITHLRDNCQSFIKDLEKTGEQADYCIILESVFGKQNERIIDYDGKQPEWLRYSLI